MNNLQGTLLEAACFKPAFMQPPGIWCEHTPFASWLVRELSPRVFLDVGGVSSNGYFAVCQAVKEYGVDTRCHAVDLWQPAATRQAVEAYNSLHYANFSTIWPDSAADHTGQFAEGSVDLMHLGGPYTGDAAIELFQTWLPRLAPEAVVLVHGINLQGHNGGIAKLWQQLCLRYPRHLAFDHSGGLGVVQLDGPSENNLTWLSATPDTQAALQRYFAALGQAQVERYTRAQSAKQGELLPLPEKQTDSDELRRLERRTAQLEQAHAELLGSQSWRVTAPLRALAHKARRFRRGLEVLRTEGLTGVRLRLQQRQSAGRAQAAAAEAASTASAPAAPIHAARASATQDARHPDATPHSAARHDSSAPELNGAPSIAVIIAAHHHSASELQATFSSLAAQRHAAHEVIVLANAEPQTDGAAATLPLPANPRWIVVAADTPAAVAFKDGLAATSAEYVMRIDAGDMLPADSLYEFASAAHTGHADLLYGDEEVATPGGGYHSHVFKPDWSPDTLMSLPYTGQALCVRRNLLVALGDACIDAGALLNWDIALRVSEQTQAVQHIPKMLLQCGPHSHALHNPSLFPDTANSIRESALRRRSEPGRLEAVKEAPGFFRVVYAPRPRSVVSIIIPTRDNGPILQRCIESIHALTGYRHFEIIILDNGSVDAATLDYLKSAQERGLAKVIRHDFPFNYSELNNVGVRAASGSVLLFLNDDTEVLEPDWLETLMGYAQRPHTGAVGAKLLYPGGELVQHVGVLNLHNGPAHAHCRIHTDEPGYGMRNLLEYNWLAVTGACLMVERQKFDAIGGFAEELPIAYNDVDLCMRLSTAGYYNMVAAGVTLIHHESVSRGADAAPERVARLQREQALLYKRNESFLRHDPFFNENLRTDSPNFELPPGHGTGRMDI